MPAPAFQKPMHIYWRWCEEIVYFFIDVQGGCQIGCRACLGLDEVITMHGGGYSHLSRPQVMNWSRAIWAVASAWLRGPAQNPRNLFPLIGADGCFKKMGVQYFFS